MSNKSSKFKGQLVSQYLENISRKLMEDYPEIIREFVKGRHGIYALYRGDILYYVGLASNLRSRLKHHFKDRHSETWDHFSIYLTLSNEHLKDLESLVLRISSPKGNRQVGRFINAQDLKRTIQRKIREIQEKERSNLLGEDIRSENQEKFLLPNERKSASEFFIPKRIHIHFRYKNKLYIAHLRKDGLITFDSLSAEYSRFKGKKYTSPSAAAQAVTNHPMNGWRCWKYKKAPGLWVPIDELRNK